MTLDNTEAFFAPIVLFVYNRLEHTQKTIDALKKNEQALSSDLFIYSDYAKTDNDTQSMLDIRDYIHQVEGFKSVTIIERAKNWGLAASIIDGVSTVCAQYGRVIVMEDDLITSPYFLRYMNDALELYKNNDEVMHVSGSTYPVQDFCDESSYFLHLPLCWGWGTWQRAWNNFTKDIDVMQQFDRKMIAEFNFDHTYDYWAQLQLNRKGVMNTWFVFWYAKVYLMNGLSLFPQKSFVKNIGMDGTGVHCSKTNRYDTDMCLMPAKLNVLPLHVSQEAFSAHKLYFKTTGMRRFSRIKQRIKALFLRGEK